jgi:glycosyltransferase involved in cell wall biosynthesis
MNDTLHVGYLAPDLTHQHGWAHYALSLLLALQRAGVRVTVIAARNSPPTNTDSHVFLPRSLRERGSGGEGYTTDSEREVGSEGYLLPAVDPMERQFLLKQLRAVSQARDALRDCNVIHSTIEPYAPLAARIAESRPLIVTGHGSYIRASQMRRFPINQIYERYLRKALLVCVSHYTAKQAALALPGIQTAVVPNGVDIERFADLPSLPKDGRTILSVGAVKRRKGTLELVQAVARASIPDIRCIIAGSLTMEADYVEQVRREISTSGLGDQVQLLGRIPDDELLKWYARADVFALPSLNDGWKFEGFGLSLLEASAAGLPVIGSRDCGAEDAVDHEETGLLIAQGDIEELAAGLVRLLHDPALRQQMGMAGKAKASRMTWDATAQGMIEVYRGFQKNRG